MNFNDIVAQVIAITKRPDKIAAARREVNGAVLFFSTDADFPRDLSEVSVPLAANELTQEISFTLLPRMRKVQYIKRGGTMDMLRPLGKTEVLSREISMANRYYTVGQGIRVCVASASSSLDIGYWQFPPYLTEASPDHWQLEGNWAAILDRAAAKVFADIGDDASAQKHERYAVTAYLAFRASQLS